MDAFLVLSLFGVATVPSVQVSFVHMFSGALLTSRMCLRRKAVPGILWIPARSCWSASMRYLTRCAHLAFRVALGCVTCATEGWLEVLPDRGGMAPRTGQDGSHEGATSPAAACVSATTSHGAPAGPSGEATASHGSSPAPSEDAAEGCPRLLWREGCHCKGCPSGRVWNWMPSIEKGKLD